MASRGESSRAARRQHRSSRWAATLLTSVVVAASAVVTVSTQTATYSATVRLAGTTIGVGPSFEPFGLSFPLMFYGTIVPEGDSFHTVPYPAQLTISLPIISDLPVLSHLPYWPQSLKRSEAIGAGYLEQDIANMPAGDKITIIGISQGTQVAEIARADMARDPKYVANADNYEFIFIGNPYQPNGGILTRLTSWSDMPVLGDLFPFGRPGPSDSPFKTTFYQNQYDGVADFPAYFNVLSLVNSFAGQAFGHAFPGYVLEYPDAPNAVTTQVGNTTYVTLPQYLPLLAPLRIPASLVGAERFVDAMDPVLRVFVEMGYDRTADPSRVKEFSWITPDEKLQEALNELPRAFQQSMAILGGEKYVPTLPQPVVSDAEPETPATPHPAEPVDTSPLGQAVRQALTDVAKAVSDASRPVAKMMQAIGGRGSRTVREPVGPVGESAGSNRLKRPATTPTDARHSPVQRLRPVGETKRPDRDSVRSTLRSAIGSAEKTPKSGHAQRHRPSTHKSGRAS
ncbi:PE-PPE domain-containing protein [Mycolicibacterium fortuitum]|uniref:PE-PPE domain-containing protein n=2 Tax=Mycolicibacterium fortuitum TaxID=1766 RepID=A0AAE5AFV9_MYCFO|nr:PE-PPE domain-containing protein [Mycolicibacterium fortuitum]MCA4754553.1 PE-PPE domain-containing protein [Mycolicibacterium fortuitum]MCV7139636.1 PE-PPE domain-containing protein [Mycolicibacterium fortuitum]MDV7195065.1 PE-PPE domain-containing protein [Mycolicibacterium fortuitum]MDV7208788.1 PE-PPE domain-containing protein [Mycolicibacterium fortuitum]MDV7230663.1 PE-PPE domain-containing protein [Mycolicibacterium fortuitum]